MRDVAMSDEFFARCKEGILSLDSSGFYDEEENEEGCWIRCEAHTDRWFDELSFSLEAIDEYGKHCRVDKEQYNDIYDTYIGVLQERRYQWTD